MDNIVNDLRIKIALDTQILAYLVDNTYPSLNKCLEVLAENPFVDLVCPRFAIYEFIGIRKLEHYLRCLVEESKSKGGALNISSALKYKHDFNAAELPYIEAYSTVKREVEKELKAIYDDFGITYENSAVHNGLWKPHQDLVLTTRISKEDSLLLLSSIFPDPLSKETHLVLLTNDHQFSNAFNDGDFIELQDAIFSNDGLIKPSVHYLKKCTLDSGKAINLTETIDDEKVCAFINSFVLEQIKRKNERLYLGKTITCACNAKLKKQLVCFRLEDDTELRKDLYLSILKTDFTLYNHPIKLSSFLSHGEIELPYKGGDTEKSKEISVKLASGDGTNIDEELMASITTPGNLVFIHPDSSI